MNDGKVMHQAICDELHDIYVAKNKDYGDSFGRLYRELGIISSVTQIVHKVERLKQLATTEKQYVNDESLEDTLLDLANYSIMTAMELRKDDKQD